MIRFLRVKILTWRIAFLERRISILIAREKYLIAIKEALE